MTPPLDRLVSALSDRYRIERELGQGGMATVYLAQDLKHDRHVALKVLRPELAAVLGAERFVQEIKTTAALQHPHILPLFDSGTADGFLFYVMPFIDGETLRAKLDRETQLGVDEAVRIAIEVADALGYAHQHGVIHRDIKPENILLQNGRPMVADFGIALAVSAAAGGRMTETGLSLGTPHYMSPEQATAEKEITARSDVYSLASVLYEMLSGEPPHMGNSAQQIIMKIITETPQPVTALRKSVPEHIAAAVAQALEKLPADRFASAAEFAAALDGRLATRARTSSSKAHSSDGRRWRWIAGILGVAVVALAALWAWALLRGQESPADRQRVEFAFRTTTSATDRPHVEISPDGRRIIQAVRDSSGIRHVVMRELGSTALALIPGTEGAEDPIFSPDGQWIAFVAGGMIRKIPLAGGLAVAVADSATFGPGWSGDGSLLFTRDGDGVWRVPASGGSAVRLTKLDSAGVEFNHWYPQGLPNGRAAIFSTFSAPFAKSRIEAVEYATGRRTVLVEGAIFGRYAGGHLLFAREGTIFAVPFDPEGLRVLGPAVPVVEDLAWSLTDGVGGFAVSATGTLVYLRASEWNVPRRVVWTDRAGNERVLVPEAGPWAEPRRSPDGRWVAITRVEPRQIWLFDIGRGVLTQLTRSQGVSFDAQWLSDSRSLIYTVETPTYDLARAPVDGTAGDTLIRSRRDKLASSVSPDGKSVIFTQTERHDRIMLAPLTGGTPTPLGSGAVIQRNGTFSPDGRWLAFEEVGANQRSDVFVRAFVGQGGRRQVSADGGDQPRWSRGGREIVYRKGDAVFAASFNSATGDVGPPTLLFRKADAGRLSAGRTIGYDVTPDGSRFLMVTPVERVGSQPVVVVLHWLDELKAKVPR